MYNMAILFIAFIRAREKKLNLFGMEENILIAPNDIFSGRIEYSDTQFRKDVCNNHNWHLLKKKDQDSLNTLIDNIIEDMKTNNEPDDFLKQFYQVSYYKLETGEGDNVVIVYYSPFLGQLLSKVKVYFSHTARP